LPRAFLKFFAVSPGAHEEDSLTYLFFAQRRLEFFRECVADHPVALQQDFPPVTAAN
jgi:hypothetical protein